MQTEVAPEKVASIDELGLPPINDEDRQFLHYNPNTSEVVEWVQKYAARAVAVERERWRGFTAHCQRVAAALKAQMTAAQVVAHLDAKMAESIDRMTSGDGSDLDPDLVEWVNQILGNEPLTLKEQS